MANLTDTSIAAFEALIRHEVEDKAIPSISYALADKSGLLAQGHIVRSDLGTALDNRSLFRIASITKTFTSVAIMQQVERGNIDLDADVSTYLPGFAPHNPYKDDPTGPFGTQISMRKLMSHTSGITREPKSGHYLDAERPSLSQTVSELADTELKQDPSIGVMQYSNAGIAVVGAVLEAVTGSDYSSYLARNILQPLGMAHTHSPMAQVTRLHPPRCGQWMATFLLRCLIWAARLRATYFQPPTIWRAIFSAYCAAGLCLTGKR